MLSPAVLGIFSNSQLRAIQGIEKLLPMQVSAINSSAINALPLYLLNNLNALTVSQASMVLPINLSNLDSTKTATFLQISAKVITESQFKLLDKLSKVDALLLNKIIPTAFEE